MFFIPFPLLIAEMVLFFFAVKSWGFLNTLGLYLLPCFLGLLIVSTMGRLAVVSLQSSLMRGELPASRLLHSGAIFLSGLLFLVPSFFTRVIGVVLFLPGLRHLAVWRFKHFVAKKAAKGMNGFSFGQGPFGFRYYSYTGGMNNRGPMDDMQERDVREANVLDVTPLKITHEVKSENKDSKPSGESH